MSKTSNVRVAQAVREARKKTDLSQEDVAACLGIAQQAYSRYETGETGISTRNLMKLCKLLGIPRDDLLLCYEKEEVHSG